MTEREGPVDRYLFTPEYWDGHGPDDACATDESPPVKFRDGISKIYRERIAKRKAKRFTQKTLNEFLLTPDRVPIRTFRKGELFDAREFPEGTIIKFAHEWLSLDSAETSYNTSERWGVVCGYTRKGMREYIVFAFNAAEVSDNQQKGLPNALFGLFVMESDASVWVGKVDHMRLKSDGTECLERTNSLAIYEFGKGVRERFPSKSRLHRLFPKPQTEI